MTIFNVVFGSVSDYVGILAGVLILISFIFKSVTKIRITNIFAAITFIIYGVLLMPNGLPLIITNAILIVIHIVFLSKNGFSLKKNKEEYLSVENRKKRLLSACEKYDNVIPASIESIRSRSRLSLQTAVYTPRIPSLISPA